MATFTTVTKQKLNWVAPIVVPGITPAADFVFSDGTDFLFSDSTDYIFSIQRDTKRADTAWTQKTKERLGWATPQAPLVDYEFSDGLDFLFSDGTDYLFKAVGSGSSRADTQWSTLTKS